MSTQPDTSRCGEQATVLLFERDRARAALYSDAVRTHLPEVRVALCAPDDDAVPAAWPSADLAVCSAGDCQRTRFDDLNRLVLSRPDGRVLLLIPGDACTCVRQALDRGACDVLLQTPGYLEQLPAVLARNFLQVRRDAERSLLLADARARVAHLLRENRSLASQVGRLQSLSVTDALTDLSNRLGVRRRLDELVASAARYGGDLSVLMIDLDGLKTVNDALGHPAGDEALRTAADCIRRRLRRADAAGRMGGDEFLVILPRTPAHSALAVARRIIALFRTASAPLQARIACAHEAPGVVHVIGRSARPADGPLDMTIGVTSLALSGSTSAEDILADADRALYAGKRAGKGRVVVHQPEAVRTTVQPGLLRAG